MTSNNQIFNSKNTSEYHSSPGGAFGNHRLMVDLFRKGFSINDSMDQPTYLTFALDFDFEGLIDDNMMSMVSSPLFAENTVEQSTKLYQSAAGFLESKHKSSLVEHVNEFKHLLTYLTTGTPWYFQSIAGLDQLWQSIVKGQTSGSIDDVELTISCIESVDLRIMRLAELYNKFVYDQKFMRAILPENLRKFYMRIYVGEVREIYTNAAEVSPIKVPKTNLMMDTIKNAAQRNSRDQSSAYMISDSTFRINSMYYYTFDCYQCEFDFSKSFANRLNVSTDDKAYETTFAIKVGRVESAGSFGPESFTSNLNRDGVAAYKANARKAMVDNVSDMQRNTIERENITLMKIAGALGPFSQTAKSALLKGDRALTDLGRAPNRFVNNAVSEIQRLAERGSLGGANTNNTTRRNF